MAKGFRQHLEWLEAHDMLLRVRKREVDPRHELVAVAKAAHRELGRAVLFERVKGSDLPVVTYVFPDRKAVAASLGMEGDSIVHAWAVREETVKPFTLVNDAPVHEVVRTGDDVDLFALPIATHCAGDAGPYITGGAVIARHPETGTLNASFNRLQLVDRDKLRVRMMPPQHLGRYHATAESLDRPLEVAVVIGAPPAVQFSAASKVPYERDELEFAGALAGESLAVTRCRTVDVLVPAESEIVLEGEVLPHVREEEGPFGEFTDGFVPVMKNHVMRVKAITHRRDAVYQNILAGGKEDLLLLGVPIEAEVFKHVRKYCPVITGVSTTSFVFNCVIGLKKEDEDQPKNVLLAAMASYSWIKTCVVVDDDVNIYDADDVWWAVQTRCRPDRDVVVVPGVSSYTREDVREIHVGKFGIDATAPLHLKEILRRRTIPGEESVRLADYLD